MKKFTIILVALLMAAFSLFALASGEDTAESTAPVTETESAADEESTTEETNESVQKTEEDENLLGDYSIVIDSCRLAKDYEGDDVVIVKYIFTNVSDDEAQAFWIVADDHVYQNGVGLNEAFILDDSVDYNSEDQMKEIKMGSSLEVEVAYELNDTETDIEVEVSKLISFSDKTITKTFSLT